MCGDPAAIFIYFQSRCLRKRTSILPQAHKALLATQSDYFRVMFTADMRERDQDKIHMKGLTAAGFGHILRFMYYGSLELSMPTVQEILQVALCCPAAELGLMRAR